MKISLNSLKSLFIEMRFDEQLLSTGTGFVALSAKGLVLITNRHNVTGRHQDTGKALSDTLGVPNSLRIWHNVKGELGHWIDRPEPLYFDDECEQPCWIEHPRLGSKADFVALPLARLDGVDLFPYDLENPGEDILIRVTETVSVVGFPFGLRAGGCLPIWATGFIASEPDVDYGDLPIQLIDCRSRQGQSGSPVVAFRSGGVVAMSDGSSGIFDGSVPKLTGIYSSRINSDSDIGMVWKTKAILELVQSI